MCWLCDNPGASRRDYIRHLSRIVERNGWAVQGVERGRVQPPWAYTIGLTRHGLPELVVTGMRPTKAAELLNDVAEHCLHAAPPKPGEVVPMVGGPTFEVVKVAQPAGRMIVATEILNTKFTALQLVHADYRGTWPWETGYRGVQPVLGARAYPPASAA